MNTALKAIGVELDTLGELATEQAATLAEVRDLALSTNRGIRDIQLALAQALDAIQEISTLRRRIVELEEARP